MEPLKPVSYGPVQSADFPQGVRRFVYRSPEDGVEDWALLWPPESGRTWVVNLHGHGSHGDQLYTRADVRRDWLSAFRRRGLGVVTPNLRDDAWMSPPAVADLSGLLEFARARHSAERFAFVSGSMGGTGALVYAALHPEDVAAAVAVCPATSIASLYAWCTRQEASPLQGEIAAAICAAYGGTPAEVPDVYRRHSCMAHTDRLTMPLYVAHGAADDMIPVGESRALATACREGNLKYREIPNGDHDAPLAARVLAEGLNWVL